MVKYAVAILGIMILYTSCEMTPNDIEVKPMTKKTNLQIHESKIGVDSSELSKGQLLFVATYSNVQWTKDQTELVGSNLSIRNTSLTEPITILYVDFFNDHGDLHENYIESEFQIAPMGSQVFHINQFDEKGGAGSNFLVEWECDVPVSPPYVENVTFRMSGAQAFAFTSCAVILRDKGLK